MCRLTNDTASAKTTGFTCPWADCLTWRSWASASDPASTTTHGTAARPDSLWADSTSRPSIGLERPFHARRSHVPGIAADSRTFSTDPMLDAA